LISIEFSQSVILRFLLGRIQWVIPATSLHFSQDFLQVIDFIRESLAGELREPVAKSLIYKEIGGTGRT